MPRQRRITAKCPWKDGNYSAYDKFNWGHLVDLSLIAGAIGGGIGLIYGAATARPDAPSGTSYWLEPRRLNERLELQSPEIDRGALQKLVSAQALWKNGQDGESEALVQQTLKGCRESCRLETKAQLWLVMGCARIKAADRAGAQEAFENALNLDPTVRLKSPLNTPDNVAAFDSVDLRRIAKTRARTQVQAIENRIEEVRVQLRAGQLGVAESILIQLLMDPGHSLSPKVRANVLVLFGIVRGDGRQDFPGARKAFNQALHLNPEVNFDAALARPQTAEIFRAAQDARRGPDDKQPNESGASRTFAEPEKLEAPEQAPADF